MPFSEAPQFTRGTVRILSGRRNHTCSTRRCAVLLGKCRSLSRPRPVVRSTRHCNAFSTSLKRGHVYPSSSTSIRSRRPPSDRPWGPRSLPPCSTPIILLTGCYNCRGCNITVPWTAGSDVLTQRHSASFQRNRTLSRIRRRRRRNAQRMSYGNRRRIPKVQ